MVDTGIKQYEMKSLINEKCHFCQGLSKIYNLETEEYEFEIPEEIGHGYFRQIVSCENIQIIDFDMTFHRQMEIQGISRTPHIDMFFCIGDGVEWEFGGKRNQFQFLNGESFLAKAKSRENVKRCIYPPEQKFHFIEIKIHPGKFQQITKNIEKEWNIFCNNSYDDIFYKYKVTPSIKVILKQILNCPYQKGLKNIYIEGKILELFAVYFNETIYQREKHNSVKLSTEDITSIYRAREILDNNIANPPTLACLSKMIYLNEFKLKKGFKEIFGETVYAYVIDRKLEMAHLLLEEKKMPVSEVASQVGYANASHFALAFRKKFGINPGEYLRSVAKQ